MRECSSCHSRSSQRPILTHHTSSHNSISREYAGTSALKGDFVRSGKRNWRGQFNDATNSIARYWQNTVLDFFKQATIDYLLGINLNAFAEFSEKMQTSDPGEIMHLKAIRQAAIDTATNTALGEGETRLYGWTLLSPTEAGQIEATNYEEKVVLVTQKALYCCKSTLCRNSAEPLLIWQARLRTRLVRVHAAESA